MFASDTLAASGPTTPPTLPTALSSGALLERHPAMAGLDELAAELHDLDVRAAAERLSGDGLVNRLGDRVGVSRAAARFNALKPV